MSITENYLKLKASLPSHVQLIAVSKTKPASDIISLYEAGHRLFGENYVQEWRDKYEQLPKDIQWHFIGHLQTNKIKYLYPGISCIQTVDSVKLFREIGKLAGRAGITAPVLLQVHIAREETKSGFSENELRQWLDSFNPAENPSVSVQGLMGMASFTDDHSQIAKEFGGLRRLFEALKSSTFAADPGFSQLSMGMSSDYRIAIDQGATLIRVGSTIFGERTYA